MLNSVVTKAQEKLGSDLYTGLIGMFSFLHFYYAVPAHGWLKSGLGFAAVLAGVFFLSLAAFKIGNGFRSALALIAAALAIDFFFRAAVGQAAASFVFEYRF